MKNNKPGKTIAIIPARGGSKRIPRKNIRSFRGKPIIEWSIKAAQGCGLFDEIMVSTDDPEIAGIALEAGASVPFMRSPVTASDTATTPEVLEEVLSTYQSNGRLFTQGCCLYPTSPLVQSIDLVTGYNALIEGTFDVIMPIVRFDYPIWRSLRQLDQGRILLNFPEHKNARSQDLPPAYHDAGQFYWFDIKAFAKNKHLMTKNTGSLLLSSNHVQDIDTEEDWALAEMKHERLYG